MELMRHSDIRLTTAICQHLELADTAGAVNKSRWSIQCGKEGTAQRQRVVGEEHCGEDVAIEERHYCDFASDGFFVCAFFHL